MNINEAYLKFTQKVNKNYTNDNIVVDRGRFVLLFNEVQNKFVEWILEKRNEDDIRDIQILLVPDKQLSLKEKILNHQDFELPKDFFSFSNIQIFGRSKGCKSTKLFSYEVKSENVEELLNDEHNKPSFKYRETFYKIGANTVNVYVDDFDIAKVYLTYYRYPRKVDIEGYTKLDETASTSIDPEFDDKIVDRILSACAKEFNINDENLQKIQFEKDRIFSRI
ncbi:MAG: hypothetical protein PQJ49_03135 [Sphaerochaetaceae bacterium]|nr:hypothetical protein [Sphaerochaetaceae bacterium]